MKKVHFMGIGGSGMNAVAGIAQSLRYVVSGCDFGGKGNEYTQSLEESGVPLSWEHSISHLEDIDILCVTPAVFDLSATHPEFSEAKARGITVMTWQEFMGKELQKDKDVIAVAGTKGKTSTTALCGLLLEHAGLDPIVEVGGKVLEWKKNYRLGLGNYFVCEADEFNNNFLHYSPKIAIITNIEMDHPEFFSSYDAYLESFVSFVKTIDPEGILILGIDSPGVRDLYKKIAFFSGIIVTYGFMDSDYKQHMIRFNTYDQKSKTLYIKDSVSGEHSYVSTMIGSHNYLNSLAIVSLGAVLRLNEKAISDTLSSFKGVGRRFELFCDTHGIQIYNDYAHNPMSVKSTLEATRLRFKEARIWAIFQPHMYSRTKLLMNDFAHSFFDADKIVVSEIFASREKGKPISQEVSSEQLVSEIKKVLQDDSERVRYIPKNDIASLISHELVAGDVIVNMGAGDNTSIAEELCSILNK